MNPQSWVSAIVDVVGTGVKNWLILGLGLLLAGSLFAHGLGSDEDHVTEADRLRTELVAERAEKAGWRVALVEGQKDVFGELQEQRARGDSLDRTVASLARELQAAEARAVSSMELVAELEGRLEARATVHRDSAGNTPDSATAELDDGLLTGRVAYLFGPERFELEYQARVAAALVAAETPDRRLMVSARALDPRVTLQVDELRYQLPEPRRVCTVKEKATWTGAGGTVGLLGGLFLGG